MSRLNTIDRWIIGSMLLTLGGVILGAILVEPRAYGITALVVMSLLLAGWAIHRDPRLAWLLVFGLVAGVLELWADWVHVTHFGSLVYTDYFGFRILASPSYMPVGWWLTVVQFGYLGLRLAERWPAWRAIGLLTVLGMLLPPWYEEFAAPARAWYYPAGSVMLSNTPVWIILTYGGCMFAIATLAVLLYAPRAFGRAVVGGIFTGASLMLSGVFWFSILG